MLALFVRSTRRSLFQAGRLNGLDRLYPWETVNLQIPFKIEFCVFTGSVSSSVAMQCSRRDASCCEYEIEV